MGLITLGITIEKANNGDINTGVTRWKATMGIFTLGTSVRKGNKSM